VVSFPQVSPPKPCIRLFSPFPLPCYCTRILDSEFRANRCCYLEGGDYYLLEVTVPFLFNPRCVNLRVL
jgi:hypothetical protein